MLNKKWADIEDDDVKWADISDEDEPGPTSAGRGPQRPQVDEKGIRTEVEYTERNGKAVKITTTYKQKKVIKKSNKFVEARKLWQPFGKCIDPHLYAEYGSNKPVRGDEEIKIELNKEKQMKALGQDEKFWEQSIIVCENIMNEAKKKKYDASAMAKRREEEAKEASKQGGIIATGGQNSTLAGKYVPPSLRSNTGQQNDRNENTLRVMNLSEDTREGDLQNLFATCGLVTRVFMPRHKEGEKEGQHKGFAFIQYRDRKDAEKAIKKLNGHGYDSLILQVSFAQPKAPN